jgi:hypothetical protein
VVFCIGLIVIPPGVMLTAGWNSTVNAISKSLAA